MQPQELESLDEQQATQELEEQDLTPDEAAASLSFTTQLQENMLPQGEEEAPQEGSETAPEGEEIEEDVLKEPDIEALVDAKVDERMKELEDKITSALTEEDEQIETTETA